MENTEASIGLYTRVLVARHEPGDYASHRRGSVLLGIGPVTELPEEGGCFGREISTHRRGVGVDVLLEVDDVVGWRDRVAASCHPILEPLQHRPWKLRIADPDGYYLRATSRSASG